MLFGAFERAATHLSEWKELEPHFRALSQFLGSRWILRRFQACCLPGPQNKHIRPLFDTIKGSKFEWKWEYAERFWLRVLVVFPTLKDKFVLATMQRGTQDDSRADPKLLTNVAAALNAPLFCTKVQVLLTIAWSVSRSATRCEGCLCHEHILHQPGKCWAERRLEYARASEGCPLKGRRGPEMAR
eukprot:8177171-Pyramimonas_sp.AAC.1